MALERSEHQKSSIQFLALMLLRKRHYQIFANLFNLELCTHNLLSIFDLTVWALTMMRLRNHFHHICKYA